MAYYYQIVLEHRGLNKHRVIRGPDKAIVEAKAYALRRAWDELWAKKSAVRQRETDRALKRRALEDNLRDADQRTREAQEELAALRGILRFTLRVDDRVDWEKLKNHSAFSKPQPVQRPYLTLAPEPQRDDPRYAPCLSLLDKMFPPLRRRKEVEADTRFRTDHETWQRKIAETKTINQRIYEQSLQEFAVWRNEASAYETARQSRNEAVERRKQSYLNLVPEAVAEHCDLVLSQSRYPDSLTPDFQVEYRPQTKTIFVEYNLPAPDDLPHLEEVRFVRTRDEFVEKALSDREQRQLYEDVLCQICLRTSHELFEADVVRALDHVVFNGVVTALDAGTGNIAAKCVMSVQVGREEFLQINLRNVDAPACFKTLGGVTGGKLIDLKPVTPLASPDGESPLVAPSIAPPNEEWQRLVSSLASPDAAILLEMNELAKCFGLPPTAKLTIAESRELVESIAARGYAIEPDVRYGAPAYRAEQTVAIFKPLDDGVRESVYSGAAALLQLCVLIAAADGRIEQHELDVFREFIEKNVALSRAEHQRLAVLEQFLLKHPDYAQLSLARIAKRVPTEKRELIGEVLVCVAAADCKITSREWRALERAFNALELAPGTLGALVSRLLLGSQEQTIQQAGAAVAGEVIPAPPESGGEMAAPITATRQETFTLDMNRVRQIAAETAVVVGILGQVMTEDVEASSPSTAASAPVTVAAVSTAVPVAPTGIVLAWAVGLDLKYQPVLARLVEKTTWPQKEFEQLAGNCKLMPVAARDAINEWSDEHLGDFLLEGEELITVHTELIPKETR